MSDGIFCGRATHDYEYALRQDLRETIVNAELAATAETFENDVSAAVDVFVSQYRLSPPSIVIPEAGLTPKRQFQTTHDVPGDFGRLGMGFKQTVVNIVFELQVLGDSKLFNLNPPTAPFGLGIVGRLALRNGIIEYVYPAGQEMGPPQVEQAIKNDLAALRRHSDAVKAWAEHWNASLEQQIRPIIVQRLQEIARQASVTKDLTIRL